MNSGGSGCAEDPLVQGSPGKGATKAWAAENFTMKFPPSPELPRAGVTGSAKGELSGQEGQGRVSAIEGGGGYI